MKSGTALTDIFRTVSLGLGGTPMPGFGETLATEQIWAVASFVSAFRGQAPAPFAVKGDIFFERPAATDENGATGTNGDLAADDGDGFWGDDAEEEESDGGGDSFWGDAAEEEEPGEAGEDFWGDDAEEEVLEVGGGEDFWGDATEEGNDDGGFWDDEDDGGSPSAVAVDPHEVAGAPVEQPEVPPATFPHWLHRVRLKCANCHPRVFEMKAGANPINMDAMRAGLYCAKCHNGKIAWQIGFTNCPRCHQARPTP